ncbi:MAG: endonuclease/exonuclease/phosphatase family protein [Gammaproteobacteria bacterium]|nr:MAG: endonuclease/exonuclease/phosphatase family protein [Gammaproteobacteria bacterium]
MNILFVSRLIILFLLFSVLSVSFPANAASNSINTKIMTFNVRVPVDPHPNDWVSRKPRVLALIKHQNPDFFGIQEALPEVLTDINNSFDGYGQIGRGRNQDSGGEGVQIFYKKKNWKLDNYDTGTLQLSPTPEIPGSNGWNMQFPRVVTWGRFIEKKSERAIYIFNTHFPLVPRERLLSATLLARTIADRKHPHDPVVLSGDFNACEAEDSIQYLLGAGNSPINLKDSYRAINVDEKTGTFHEFGKQNESCKVDYIFTSSDITVVASEIIKDDPKIGFSSDHYAVTAKLKIIKTH